MAPHVIATNCHCSDQFALAECRWLFALLFFFVVFFSTFFLWPKRSPLAMVVEWYMGIVVVCVPWCSCAFFNYPQDARQQQTNCLNFQCCCSSWFMWRRWSSTSCSSSSSSINGRSNSMQQQQQQQQQWQWHKLRTKPQQHQHQLHLQSSNGLWAASLPRCNCK